MKGYKSDKAALADAKKRLSELSIEAIEVIEHLAKYCGNENVRLSAAKTIIEYNLGKPAQAVDVDVTHNMSQLSDDEVMQRLRERLLAYDQMRMLEEGEENEQ